MTSKIYEDGNIILKEDDPINKIIFIEYGCIEVYTEFEGHEFVIERLYQCSVINAQAFLTEDQMYVSLRSKGNCKILEIPKALMDHFLEQHSSVMLSMMKHQNFLLISEKKFPLNYLIREP